MFKRAVLVAGLVIMPSCVQAQLMQKMDYTPRNEQVMAGLFKAVTAKPTYTGDPAKGSDKSLTSVRGGNGDKKPLGQYMVEPNVEFKSDYRKLSPGLQCRFAYDLHEFIKNKGRDWPAMYADSKLKYVPYEKQREFADFWWLRNCPEYKGMGFFFKDGFLKDALVDATNIYNWYARKDYESANYVLWEDAALQDVVKEK